MNQVMKMFTCLKMGKNYSKILLKWDVYLNTIYITEGTDYEIWSCYTCVYIYTLCCAVLGLVHSGKTLNCIWILRDYAKKLWQIVICLIVYYIIFLVQMLLTSLSGHSSLIILFLFDRSRLAGIIWFPNF